MNPSPAAIADAHRRNAVPFARRVRAEVRRTAGIACALIALAPLPLAAIGLGPVAQQSALGQPLRVVVSVLLADGEDVPSECFKITPARSDADGIPQLLFGRIAVERTPSGTQVVVSNARPVSDPVVRLTIQAGCETSIRREYTLLMDPPVIQPPVAAAEAPARDDVAVPPARPAPRAAARGKGGGARSASASGRDAAAEARKTAPPRSRAAAKTTPAPRRQPAPSVRPRFTVSSAPPVDSAGARAATDAEREKEQQERARAIDAETAALRERIVVLTAMVERMQAEVRAQEMAQRAAEEAAKAPPPPPPPEPAWWEANELLLVAIVGLPIVIALLLLWRRRRDAITDAPWRATRPPAARAPPPASGLRNAPAGLANPATAAASTPAEPKVERVAPDRNATSVLAVSELSQVTEEARVYVALGHHDRAIDVLNEHVRQMPRSMPAAWLMLLDLCHARGRQQEFRRLAEEFHLHFNVQTPSWEGFAPNEPDNGGLELYPQVIRQITEHWRKPESRAYLERLLYDNREGRRNGFPLAAYADILLLLQILDASVVDDIDSDLMQDGKLDLAHGAADAARPSPPTAPAKAEVSRARKPMPPDPAAAARPVQQPIRFEFEPDSTTRDSRMKPGS